MDCLSDIIKFDTHKSSVSLLEDLLRTQGINNVQFNLLQAELFSRNRELFKYRVTDGRFVAFGQGDSKREARESAAKNFLWILNKEIPELCPDSLLESHMKDNLVINKMINSITLEDTFVQYSPVDELHKLCTSRKYTFPVYITESVIGLPHKRIYTISCNLLNYKETGEGNSKKKAKRLAAHKTLLILKQKQVDLNKNNKTNTKESTNTDDLIQQEFAMFHNRSRSSKPNYFKQLPKIHKNLPLTEGHWFNFIKGMQDEQLKSCDSKQVLNNFIAEQGLKLTFIDFEEISHGGTYQTSLQVNTPITLAFCGESSSYEEAHKLATINALEFFKTILSNRAYKSS